MSKEQVTEARDLLEMLESLTEHLANGKFPQEIPWPGISTTLKQCKELLDEHLEQKTLTRELSQKPKANGVTLADKIRTIPKKSVPRTSKVREIDINLGSDSYSIDDEFEGDEFEEIDLESEEGRFYFS